jgi:hypothetical protein
VITYLGQRTIGEAVPAATIAVDCGTSGIGLSMPDLSGRISAMQAQLAALATMPPFPTFPEMVAQASFNLAQLQIAITVPGIPPPPSIAGAIAAFEALLEGLLAMAASVQADLTSVLTVGELLAVGGIYAFAYDGTRGAFGGELQSAINSETPGPGSATTRALVLVAMDSATWAGMSQAFKVSL